MTDDFEDLDDNLGLDDFPTDPPPVERSYNGWHMPRKQVVRHAQWAAPLKTILKDRVNDLAPVSYLGLPGRDLLDVRHLINDVCQPLGRTIKFYGFDSAASADDPDNPLLNTAYADLLRSDFVDSSSVVTYENILRIADTSTQAYKDACRRAPYDVINLDFCEAMLGREATAFPLLKRLFTIQKTRHDWLLLVTSYLDAESFSDVTLSSLLPLLEQNRADCAGFEEEISAYLELPEPLTAEEARTLGAHDFFVLGALLAGKWILREALKEKFTISIVNVAGYSLRGDTKDMLSLSVRVRPMFVSSGDDAGLVQGDEFDECSGAVSLARALGKIDDVDEWLADEAERTVRFTRDSIALVRSANHPLGPYLRFLREEGVAIPDDYGDLGWS